MSFLHPTVFASLISHNELDCLIGHLLSFPCSLIPRAYSMRFDLHLYCVCLRRLGPTPLLFPNIPQTAVMAEVILCLAALHFALFFVIVLPLFITYLTALRGFSQEAVSAPVSSMLAFCGMLGGMSGPILGSVTMEGWGMPTAFALFAGLLGVFSVGFLVALYPAGRYDADLVAMEANKHLGEERKD